MGGCCTFYLNTLHNILIMLDLSFSFSRKKNARPTDFHHSTPPQYIIYKLASLPVDWCSPLTRLPQSERLTMNSFITSCSWCSCYEAHIFLFIYGRGTESGICNALRTAVLALSYPLTSMSNHLSTLHRYNQFVVISKKKLRQSRCSARRKL